MEEVLLGVSKVLHIRNLPDNVSERDLIAFGLQFGSVTNVLLLRAKNQAFLEMVDSNTAAAMLSYYSNNPATIRWGLVSVPSMCFSEFNIDLQ